MSERFRIIVPIATPYSAVGGVDLSALRRHAELLAQAGVDGFFVAGSTGEGPLLADDEVIAAARAVREAAPDLPLIAQVGRPATEATCVLAQRVIDAGADAAAAVTPYYYDLDDERALAHYTALIDAVAPAAAVAYVIPRYARNDLSPSCVRELAARGLAGIKDSTGSLERHREYVVGAEGVFRTFVGSDALMLAAIGMGSSGVIPALANLRPQLFVELLAAAEGGDMPRAAALAREMVDVHERLRSSGRSLKQAVAQMMTGHSVRYSSAVRSPLQ